MVTMQWIAVEAIKPNVRNARTHSRKQIRQIERETDDEKKKTETKTKADCDSRRG
jgi:hypothetical protein